MKYIKEHWPVALYIIALVVSLIEWIINDTSDSGVVFVLFVMIIIIMLPLCAFILSIWYGYRLRDKRKWLIPLACVVPTIIMTIVFGTYKFWENYPGELLSIVVALIGMLIGSALWKTRKVEE